jgi:hypothetical protein
MAKTELQKRIGELIELHGGNLSEAARVLKIDKGYLWRLWKGYKTNASPKTLKKLKLRRVETLVTL